MWLGRLDRWVGFVADASLSPESLTVQSCPGRLDDVGDPPTEALDDVRSAAGETCAALAEASRLRRRALNNARASELDEAAEQRAEGERLLGLLLAGMRAGGFGGGGRSRVVAEYGRVAEKLVGIPIEARCWSGDNWRRLVSEQYPDDSFEVVGFTGVFGDGRIHLAPVVCAALDRLRRGERVADAQAAEALGVLAHEAEHAVGRLDEAVAECYAMQHVRAAARELGVEPRAAGRLAVTYWRRSYPKRPAEYRTPRCRNGGPLDRRRHIAEWP
jgi:hypothetical protein